MLMSSYLQKCGPGVGTLPQLEPQVVQVVVSNAKNQQQQSDNILPQIANKGGKNNYQTQVRQCRPTAVCVESMSNVLHQRLDMETFSRTNFSYFVPIISVPLHSLFVLLYRMRGQSLSSSLVCASAQQWIECHCPAAARFSATSWRKRSHMRDRGYPCRP